MKENHLIEVEGLKKYFNVGNGKIVKAVDDLNFYIREGETLGMVGESGCGKSTAKPYHSPLVRADRRKRPV